MNLQGSVNQSSVNQSRSLEKSLHEVYCVLKAFGYVRTHNFQRVNLNTALDFYKVRKNDWASVAEFLLLDIYYPDKKYRDDQPNQILEFTLDILEQNVPNYQEVYRRSKPFNLSRAYDLKELEANCYWNKDCSLS